MGAHVPRPAHPTLPLAAAVGGVAILVASLVGGRFLVEALATLDWPIVVYVAILVVIGYGPSLGWAWWVSHRWGHGDLGDDVGVRFRGSDAGWGPVVWLAAVGTQIVVASIVLAIGVPTSSNTEGVGELDADRGYVIAVLIAAVVAAPIAEELLFRGVIMRGLLSRLPAVAAIAAQGALFGAAHVDPVRGRGNLGLALILGGVGVAFGTGAYLLRRIGPTVIAHAIFNAVVLTIVLTGALDGLRDDASARQATVVDQPHVAEPHGDHHQRAVDGD